MRSILSARLSLTVVRCTQDPVVRRQNLFSQTYGKSCSASVTALTGNSLHTSKNYAAATEGWKSGGPVCRKLVTTHFRSRILSGYERLATPNNSIVRLLITGYDACHSQRHGWRSDARAGGQEWMLRKL
jgi:hypothetical protein